MLQVVARLFCAIAVGCMLLLPPIMWADRAASWKPERMLGSARLATDSIEWLVLPAGADDDLHAAAADLLFVMKERGAKVSLGGGERKLPKRAIILRRDTGHVRRGGEAFSIQRKDSRIFLTSSSISGLKMGLYEIAHEAYGSRWYWPGELGFELAGGPLSKFSEGNMRGIPAFSQRTLHRVDAELGRRNRMNLKYSFNHNLARVFNEEIFEQYPEVFAEIGGRRERPTKGVGRDPQPDFTEPRAVEIAAQAAREHFLATPESNSFSLSINDNSLFDEGAETEAVIRGSASVFESSEVGRSEGEIPYFRGRPNYTDLVFGFMNAVAERVFGDPEMLETPSGEPRCLTALAYYSTEQSPSFEIHPRVMPVLTSDRAQWHDSDYRFEDKLLIKRWAESGAERIATWDYFFGAPYPYPRQLNQWIGESIKFLRGRGADVFFSQVGPIWGLDGPKVWLAAQLLWDPKQDVAALLNEFYTNFFGAAAGPIREFYEFAEKTRNEREGEAEWIKFYKDEAGIELFDEATLQAMRSFLESAEDLVRDDERRAARVLIVSEAFSFTEAYANFHSKRTVVVERSLSALNGGEVSAEELFVSFRAYKMAERKFEELKERLVQEPLHKGFLLFDRIQQSNPKGLFLAALANCAVPDSLTPELSSLLGALEPWKQGRGSFDSMTENPLFAHQGSELRNFLGPEIPKIEGWAIDYRASEGLSLVASDSVGAKGLRVENADIVSVDQTFPIISGKHYMLEVEAAWKVSPDNRTWLQLVWKDISGETLLSEVVLRLPNGASHGVQRIAFVLDPPTNACDLKVGVVTNRQYSGDFLELRRVDAGVLVPEP